MREAKEKQKEKNKGRSEKMPKGITLIALVITIIVLLILAGVSIATLTGENGILTKANEAKDKTQIADVKEQVQMDILAEQMKADGGDLSEETLGSILGKYFEGFPKEEGELEKGLKDGLKLNSKSEYGGQEVDIRDIYDGDLVKEPLTADKVDELVKNKEKVQYVTNYGIDIDNDEHPEDDWEIFYVEDYSSGEDSPQAGNQPTKGQRIFLIASDYVHAETKALQEAVVKDKASMTSGTDGADDSSHKADYVKYWTSSGTGMPEYHCTLPNEVGENGKKACTFPKLFEFSQYSIKDHKSNSNSKCASSLLCTGNWSSFANDWADYATGGPSVEMWMDSWNKRHADNKRYCSKSDKCGANGYYVGSTENPDSGYSTSVSNTDPLYFPHTSSTGDFDNDYVNEYCYGCWLASPSAKDYYYVLGVYYRGYVDYNIYSYESYGVRPVVCLKSNVKLVKSSKTLDGKENAECFELVK